MKLSTQSEIISKATGNNLNNKIKNDPDFRKLVVKNIEKDINFTKKNDLLYNIEIENLSKYIQNTKMYKDYSKSQLFNIAKGYELGLNVDFYNNINYPPSSMALRRMILLFNKNNSENAFDLSYFNKSNNDNKIRLLFEAHKYNISNPNNKIDLEELTKIFDLNEIKKIIKEHKEFKETPSGIVREVTITTKPAPKKKSSQIIEKNIDEMSFGELADFWNEKHPKAQINSAYIWAQTNKKIQEMIYFTSIYNLKFKDRKIPVTLFAENEFTMEQKNEILTGLKYNLKNTKSPIPVEKYVRVEIPADNMRIINKIMRLMSEYKVSADIDFIIENCKDRHSLNTKYEQLFQTKQDK